MVCNDGFVVLHMVNAFFGCQKRIPCGVKLFGTVVGTRGYGNVTLPLVFFVRKMVISRFIWLY